MQHLTRVSRTALLIVAACGDRADAFPVTAVVFITYGTSVAANTYMSRVLQASASVSGN